MQIKIPELSLVVLVGTSGAGKSSFARKHFKPTEILSSDTCRGWVSDDENSQSATPDAFDVLNFIAGKRLKNGLLTVIDATNVQQESRKGLVELARQYHVLPVAIVLDLPERLCEDRNKNRPDRQFGAHVIRQQRQQLKRNLKWLKQEGFKQVYHLQSVEEVEAVEGIIREKLYNNKKDETAPLDIIGDVHGCYAELVELLEKLGYRRNLLPTPSILEEESSPKLSTLESEKSPLQNGEGAGGEVYSHPEGRKAVFVGDLVDRGEDTPQVLRLVMAMVQAGKAYCVCGNHDSKLQKYLIGKQVQLKHGLEVSAEQLAKETPEFRKEVEQFLHSLISHYVFDKGNLVVAHAGLKAEMQGRGSAKVRDFCMYGETTGEIDEFGLPVRYNWAKEYRGNAKVVYGHTPIPQPEWLNRTINIDTGCVFGGKLTALRYPEEVLVSVEAKKVYCEPARPIGYQAQTLTAQQEDDGLLDLDDVVGKRIVQTRLKHNITIREENSIVALEVMSRFAVNPKWLIYLPPTMSPCATSDLPTYLEHPAQALNYYKKRGIDKVICEEKHMGSRAVIVLCRDEEVALKRFGIQGEGIGTCYTRTGRRFFNDKTLEQAFLARVGKALTISDFWEKHQTDWVCLDCELMPWSAKAQSLIRDQYASVGASALASLPAVAQALAQTASRGLEEAKTLLAQVETKQNAVNQYIKAYQHYCWDVQSLDDYKLAPFHILATEGKVHTDKTHAWHMENIAEFCAFDAPFLLATPYKMVDFQDETSYEEAVNWWTALTESGGEGMVVKPYDFLAYEKTDLLQPAVKCRGSEYLRIIYGAEYDMPHNLERLKNRGLSRKQSLALREFALGIEALERFVRREPLRRVHESVFGVLALESEEVDPRL